MAGQPESGAARCEHVGSHRRRRGGCRRPPASLLRQEGGSGAGPVEAVQWGQWEPGDNADLAEDETGQAAAGR